MEWSCEKCLNLIEEYKKEESLWNPKDQFYYSKNRKHEAWICISKKLDIDMDEVKKKMMSLLGSFRRERARIKSSMNEHSDEKRVYKSKWFAYNSMQFLLVKDEHFLSLRNAEAVNKDENMCEDLYFDEAETPEVDENGENSFYFDGTHFSAEFPHIVESHDDKKDSVGDALQIIKNAALAHTSFLDECSVFGQHVGNKLRNYSSKTRVYVEHAINNILFEADLGKFDHFLNSDSQESEAKGSSSLCDTSSNIDPVVV